MSDADRERRVPKSQWILECVGITEEDQAHLRLLLRSARKHLDAEWVWGAESDADLLLIDSRNPIDDSDIRRATRRKVAGAQIIDAEAPAPEGLSLRRPFHKDAFTALLNEVAHGAGTVAERRGEIPPAVPVAAAPATSVAALPADKPATNADEELRRSLLHYLPLRVLGGPARIVLSGVPPLVIDPEKRMFWASGTLPMLEPYIREPLRFGDWQRLTGAELEQACQDLEARPYACLIWMDGFIHSKGILSRRFDPEGTYRLTKRLELANDYPRALRISAQMGVPRRLDAIARMSSAEPSEVFDVVNAYEAVGFLEWTRAAATSRKPDP